jgi:hypothetical protein
VKYDCKLITNQSWMGSWSASRAIACAAVAAAIDASLGQAAASLLSTLQLQP